MLKFKAGTLLIIGLTALSFAIAPTAASARARDKPNSGICKSGKQVGDLKNCKDNGGKQ